MADTGADSGGVLARAAAREFARDGEGVRLAAEPRLGVAKLQVLADDPNAWFAETLGTAAPVALREVAAGPVACAWLAPGEWLVTGAEDDVERVRRHCADAAGQRGLMVDLTHARASYELSGAAARTVLAAHCPLDLSDAAMPCGAAARSTFSDTAFFLSRRPDRNDRPCFRLIVDQTMAAYAERLLAGTIAGMAR